MCNQIGKVFKLEKTCGRFVSRRKPQVHFFPVAPPTGANLSPVVLFPAYHTPNLPVILLLDI